MSTVAVFQDSIPYVATRHLTSTGSHDSWTSRFSVCRADRDLPLFHPRCHGYPRMCLQPLSQFQEEIPDLQTRMFNVHAPGRITGWMFASRKVDGLGWRGDSRAAQVLMVRFLTVAMLPHSIDGPVSCLSPMKTRRPVSEMVCPLLPTSVATLTRDEMHFQEITGILPPTRPVISTIHLFSSLDATSCDLPTPVIRDHVSRGVTQGGRKHGPFGRA